MKINVIITGATGMVGKGVLLECLESAEIGSVLVIVRSSTGVKHKKLKELTPENFYDLSGLKDELKGYQACFFCLGVSAFGLNEEQYTKITYHLTINLAKILVELNPEMVFNYVSGTGTDSSEKGRTMWARVKGRTENAILNMGFRDAYAFRPGLIIPEEGIKSRTRVYNVLYTFMKPFFPWLKKQSFATTTSRVGKAMIRTAIYGYHKKYLENRDINLIAS